MALIRRSQCGKFSIPVQWVHDEYLQQLFKAILAGCLIVRAEVEYTSDTFKFDALHEDFPEIMHMQLIPTYKPIIKQRVILKNNDPYREVGMDMACRTESVFIGWKESIAQAEKDNA